MTSRILTILWLEILFIVSANQESRAHSRPTQIFSNHFAVFVPSGIDNANEIARRHGFDNHGQVSL